MSTGKGEKSKFSLRIVCRGNQLSLIDDLVRS